MRLRGALDGLLLCLHGALAGESEPDVDGQIIDRAREIVGEDTVIGVALDMHANLTRQMVAGRIERCPAIFLLRGFRKYGTLR